MHAADSTLIIACRPMFAESEDRTHRRAYSADARNGGGLVQVWRTIKAHDRLLLSRRAKASVARCKPLSAEQLMPRVINLSHCDGGADN